MNLTFQYLIRSLAHQMKNYADKRLDDFGITQEQSHTLGYIYRHQEEGMTQKTLLEAFDRKGSTVSSTLKILESKGLIYRKVNPKDTRSKLLKLTDEGITLVESFIKIFDEIEENMLKDFTDNDKEKLREYFDRMMNNLK
ncbi:MULTISPECIES: MarR family winged helix-turn-helix transcriptional regulator [Staphylococcus]|uniref:MarR family regulatory protein n=3 Tax=Staphylococcus TaxID=1279 RepID=A0ABM7FNN2_9STAP|nr:MULTISPECIES: MarR family transcriptional regulator [Staphylococcus]EES41859.1 transcriptional regulator, MarR family [Staphylococcus caprae M23864:W1]MBN6826153.1 MarR family transcriptional regulator [Staphylococcus caprae]MBU5272213.1 MarR family transcriptional regulator [Staphylococcus caprae]MBX5317623.1 MarR family transcriptional regulator [Staphylococcus caprae]MBX5319384.1 MarR family transcriptional regulator [Staphylococcus caprae]